MKHKKCWLALAILTGGLSYYFYPDHYPLYPESDHYSTEKQQFFNPVPEGEIDGAKMRSALWDMIFHSERFMPSAPLPMMKPDFNAFLAPSDNAKFIWFGHSSLLARVGDQTIFIDPVFAKSASPVPIMMKRFQAPPAELAELPPVDWIVLSHNHYDHLDQTVIEHYKSQKTQFVVPLGVGVLLQKWGIAADRIRELDWWQSTSLAGLELHAVPARHNTGRGMFDRNKTLWAGYVLKTPTEQFYYSSDSSFGDGAHFRQIAERFGTFDIAFVENGQYNPTWIDSHMLPEQTAEVVKMLKPQHFVPVHWGAYALSIHQWDDPVKRSVPLIEQSGISLLSPLMGQVFDKNTATEKWWLGVK